MSSAPWCLSFVIGFLSLSEEILWVRVVGFRFGALPPAFSLVLAGYLVGIALGAAYGKRLCGRIADLYAAAALVLCLAALSDVVTPYLIGHLIFAHPGNLWLPAGAIALTAALKSILFPMVHHLGSSRGTGPVGRAVARIYFGNIAGATLGPVVTGFLALETFSVDECFGMAAGICLMASAGCVLKSRRPHLVLVTLAAAVACSAIAMRVMLPGPGSLGELAEGGRASMVEFIANRHGVIHTARTTQGDFVFGGNVYDGIASVDVDANPNRLDRLYILALLGDQPRRVLFVGLSAGAWVRCIEGFPGIDRIDVVEINPGYLELTRTYPRLAPLLEDPRIHMHVDDGRRWLRRHPDSRFDAIVQNTTYHWRANGGNLLSREYLEEVGTHLNPGGVFVANTTGSYDVLATAQAVFAHAYRYANFVYASDRPLTPDARRLASVRRPDGAPLPSAAAHAGGVAAFLAVARLEPVGEFLARRHVAAGIITDDNLLSEYRHGLRFGPALLQFLLPPVAPQFELVDP